MTTTEIIWTKSKDGWGCTEYRAVISGLRVVARKTGNRVGAKWHVVTDTWPHRDEITSGKSLTSAKASAAHGVARFLAKQKSVAS
jgi:hypothetical protein